jgi:hypothetical protein
VKKLLLFLLLSSPCFGELKTITHNGHTIVVETAEIVAIRQLDSNDYYSRRQKKIIFLDPNAYSREIGLGLKNGNLTRMPITEIMLGRKDPQNARSIRVYIPVIVIVETLGLDPNIKVE